MKVLILGALLLQTLDAQGIVSTNISAAASNSSGLAPLLIPNPNAPTEVEVLAAAGNRTTEADPDFETPSEAAIDRPIFQTGTADVIIEPSPRPGPVQNSSDVFDVFGGNATFGQNAKSNTTTIVPPMRSNSSTQGTGVAGLSANKPTIIGPLPKGKPSLSGLKFPFTNSTPTKQPGFRPKNVNSSGGPPRKPTTPAKLPIGPTSDDSESFTEPASLAPGTIKPFAKEPPQPGADDATSPLDLTRPASIAGVFPENFAHGSSFDSSPEVDAGSGSVIGAQAADGPGPNPRTTEFGIDTANFDTDSSDTNDEDLDEECPTWCLEDSDDETEYPEDEYSEDDSEILSDPDFPDSETVSDPEFPDSEVLSDPEFPDSETEPEPETPEDGSDFVEDFFSSEKLRRGHRRRQTAPSPTGGFASFQFPSKEKPPGCPASCYKALDTSTSTNTTTTTTLTDYFPTPVSNYSSPTISPPYSNSTLTTYYGYTTPISTFVTSTSTGLPYLNSSIPLASICPQACDPSPLYNKCDITSSCTATGGVRTYCACRAGFRSSQWNAKDFTKQFKVPGQLFVYTGPGVVCDLVCDDQTCTEVPEMASCL